MIRVIYDTTYAQLKIIFSVGTQYKLQNDLNHIIII